MVDLSADGFESKCCPRCLCRNQDYPDRRVTIPRVYSVIMMQ